ncbi:MAG: hypothetical protein C4526_09905 [Nitrospiraceae bacterium]|nr:MAG: hypothetical protein C4526_09905 [Nitrospiraceae bacterium]
MNWFSYQIELFKKSKERDQELKKLHKLAKEAGEKGGYGKMLEVYNREDIDLRTVEEEIDLLKTQYVKNKISKSFYSLPPTPITDGNESEIWMRGSYTAEWLLTKKGFEEANNIILKIRKERRENISFWVTILFGLLGLVIGLISVLNK